MRKIPCILLVDDDTTTNYLNQLQLNRLGVADKLLVALNGREALNILHKECGQATKPCPTLILLDLKMPVMDGFAFLEAYHRLPETYRQANAVVVLTTSLHPHDVARVQQLGVTAFISKPLNQEKVHALMAAYFPEV